MSAKQAKDYGLVDNVLKPQDASIPTGSSDDDSDDENGDEDDE